MVMYHIRLRIKTFELSADFELTMFELTFELSANLELTMFE